MIRKIPPSVFQKDHSDISNLNSGRSSQGGNMINIKDLATQITEIYEKSCNSFQRKMYNTMRMEERLQEIVIDIPKLPRGQQQRKWIVQEWMITLCKTVFSTGFKLYDSGSLDLNKVKAYCSENILKNFFNFSEINNLTTQQVKGINKLLQKDLLPYFCNIYPESEEAESSAKFSSDLIERDAMDDNDYELIYKSKVDFSFQANGNYNSAIMKFLNFLVSLTTIKQEANNKQVQLNSLFEKEMTQLFRKVQSQENLLNMLSFNMRDRSQSTKPIKMDPISQKQKQEYQQKVRQYTSFKIGQKLSKNLKTFSQAQIEAGDLELKNSEVIRVITKWCEELQSVFDSKSMLNREVAFRMKNGQQKYISLKDRKRLAKLLQEQQEKVIKKTKQLINQNNYKNQNELLRVPINKQLMKFSKGDSLVGNFCSLIYKNNASYLITYLNSLIHGINQAARNFSIALQNYTPSYTSQNIPELITFRIGDLMRCKCESKQTQIIALYKQIERMHSEPNSNLKIIRVKNRLDRGNKDILMNLLYRNKMVVEMQLSIKSGKSRFIQNSYNFNHYLYQLKRAPFGPIMEMCNVWVNKDLKSDFYMKKIESVNCRDKLKLAKKQLNEYSQNYEKCCKMSKQPIKLPFRCSICSYFYTKINQNFENIECKKCGKEICYLCQLEISKNAKQNLIEHIKSQFDFSISEIIMMKQKLSKVGALLNLKARNQVVVKFHTVLENDEYYLFQYNQRKNQVQLIHKLKSENLQENFLNQNFMFSSPEIEEKLNQQQIKVMEAANKYFLNGYLKKTKQKQKTFMSLMNKNIKQQDILKFKIDNWPSVRKLDISENKELKDISQVVQKFPSVNFASLNSISLIQLPQNIWRNLIYLDLSDNNLSSVSNLEKCTKIQEINLERNNLSEFPKQLFCLQKLISLNLNRNKLSQLPKQIEEFKNLRYLSFSNNKLTNLPEQIGNLKQLRMLQCYRNQIQQFPTQIGNLTNLEQISMSSNELSELPEQIGNLRMLAQLFIDDNNIKELPKSFSNLKSLRYLSLSGNVNLKFGDQITGIQSLQILSISQLKLKQFPQFVCKSRNLWNFTACNNCFQTLPEEFGNLQLLQYCNLQANQFKSMPTALSKLKNLVSLSIFFNKLNLIPSDMGRLASLKLISLSNNLFKQFPEWLTSLSNLQKLTINGNKISNLPESIGKLRRLKYLDVKGCDLVTLPEALCDLTQLEYLNVSFNKALSLLPKRLENLTSLETFCCEQTQIQQIPFKLTNMKNLKQICSEQVIFTQLPIQFFNRISSVTYTTFLRNPATLEVILFRIQKISNMGLTINLKYGIAYRNECLGRIKQFASKSRAKITFST